MLQTPSPRATGWAAAVGYYERHHHLNVPSEYTDSFNYPLGLWIGQQRSLYAKGDLAPDRALALEALHISWPNPPRSFESRLTQAIAFADAHGTLTVTTAPSTSDGPMYRWLHRQRALADSGRMHSARSEALKAVDPWWNPPWGTEWQHDYTHVCLQAAHQTATPTPVSGQTPATWLDHQIARQHELHPQQLRLLSDLAAQHPSTHPHSMLLLPASHSRTRAFHRGLKAARQFHRREGHLQVPAGHRENLHGNEVLLNRWITKHRSGAAQLTSLQITALTALGIEPEQLRGAALPAGASEEAGAWWAAPEPSWAAPIRRFAG